MEFLLVQRYILFKMLCGLFTHTIIQHCAYDNCTLDLVNYQGGSFCQIHEHEFGNKCCVKDCMGSLIPPTMACAAHQDLWNKYKLDHSAGSLAGSKRILNHCQENLPWNSRNEHGISRIQTQSLNPSVTMMMIIVVVMMIKLYHRYIQVVKINMPKQLLF